MSGRPQAARQRRVVEWTFTGPGGELLGGLAGKCPHKTGETQSRCGAVLQVRDMPSEPIQCWSCQGPLVAPQPFELTALRLAQLRERKGVSSFSPWWRALWEGVKAARNLDSYKRAGESKRTHHWLKQEAKLEACAVILTAEQDRLKRACGSEGPLGVNHARKLCILVAAMGEA